MGDKIAGMTLAEWREFARRDDCLNFMVPSDLRQLVAALPAAPAEYVRAGALYQAANAIWDGPIREYARAAQGPELQAAHKCRDAILALIPEARP